MPPENSDYDYWRMVELLGNSNVVVHVSCCPKTRWSVTIDGSVRSQGMATAREAIVAGIVDCIISGHAIEST